MDQSQIVDEEVRHALKMLKAISTSAQRRYENHLHMALVLHADLIARKGEAWHQLALKSVERIDYNEAAKRFEKAKSSLNASKQPLAYARVLRDEAWFTAFHLGEIEHGLEIANKALSLHENDLNRARGRRSRVKGRRQELITQTYIWRIQHLATSSDNVLSELARVIEHEGQAFCERDQLMIIEFLIPRVGIEERLNLLLRSSQLNAAYGSIASLPYRTVLRSVTFGLSTLRWLGRSFREE